MRLEAGQGLQRATGASPESGATGPGTPGRRAGPSRASSRTRRARPRASWPRPRARRPAYRPGTTPSRSADAAGAGSTPTAADSSDTADRSSRLDLLSRVRHLAQVDLLGNHVPLGPDEDGTLGRVGLNRVGAGLRRNDLHAVLHRAARPTIVSFW